MITENKIREIADTVSVYQRGCAYFQQGLVRNLAEAATERYTAEVCGSQVYRVTVRLLQRSKIQRCACECPAYYQYEGACKHIVAVLKEIQAQQRAVENILSQSAGRSRLLSLYQDALKPERLEETLPIRLVPACHLQVTYQKVTAWLEFTIGRTRQYVLKGVEDFLQSILFEQRIVYGKEFVLEPPQAVFDEISQRLMEMMLSAYEDERSMKWGYSASGVAVQKKFMLAPSNLARFFTIMQEETFVLSVNGRRAETVHLEVGRPPIRIALKEDFGKGRISIGEDALLNLDPKFQYILYNGAVIYKVDPEFSACVKPLIQCLKEENGAEIAIGKEEVPEFFSTILPELEKVAPVKVDVMFMENFEILPLNPSIYLDREDDGIQARISFSYGERTLNPAVLEDEASKRDGKYLIRDAALEKQILFVFRQYGFAVEGDAYVQRDEEKSYDFLADALPKLADCAEIYYAEGFGNKEIKRMRHITAGIRINDENMLEMSLVQADFNLGELMEILSSYRLRKRYHRLKDGTFIPLEEEELETIADFMDQFSWKPGKAEETVKIPLAKAVYLDTLARDTQGLQLERSTAFKKMVQDIKEPMDVEAAVPESLRTVLRDYQKTGFKWLTTLARYGLGGILADDMGLGKTLQVIAFLLAEKPAARLPSLIVMPTSLLYNWLEEIERFAPELKAVVVSGTQPERAEKLGALEGTVIVLTTYNLLKRDIELYKALRFQYCFLDEAQHIKNPGTQNAKTVKQLKTQGYFALTGTPIENTLTELWSIFDFLMPGYLFTHQAFKRRFELPIVKNADRRAAKELHRYIAPFVLRRLKREVLKELPDKTESKMLGEMTEQQAKLYAGYFVQAQKEFEEELEKHGFARSQIKILSILTRLRQICCHPSLFLEDYMGGSGKLDMLREVVEGAVESGHRILIFSQFTSMLAILRDELTGMGIAYDYLDGQTPSLERMRLVKSFNSGETPVFLISLKAGGTGLNLTGADMVIHYDPWWNPAVEEQATDRAYRLGQKKNVQVLKFIMKDTIEENIFKLQQKKKGLIDQMIQPGETFVSKLSEEELRALFKR